MDSRDITRQPAYARHVAVFGTSEVLDVLLGAGARIGSVTQAAAAGDVTGWLRPEISLTDRILMVAMAADDQRLEVIDAVLEADTPWTVRTRCGDGKRCGLRRATGNRERAPPTCQRRGSEPRRPRARSDRAAVVPTPTFRRRGRIRSC